MIVFTSPSWQVLCTCLYCVSKVCNNKTTVKMININQIWLTTQNQSFTCYSVIQQKSLLPQCSFGILLALRTRETEMHNEESKHSNVYSFLDAPPI